MTSPLAPLGIIGEMAMQLTQPRSHSGNELVALLRTAASTGNHEECEQLYALLVRQYQNRVFRLVLAVLGPGAGLEAEDVTQEVFLQVFRRLDTFRSESAFSTWLFSIAKRRAIDLKRRARYRYTHQNDEVLAALDSIATGAGRDSDALADRLDEEERLRVYAAVEALPEPQRSALYMHYWMDETIETIAQAHDTRPGTVKSWLFRSRRKIARLLESDSQRVER